MYASVLEVDTTSHGVRRCCRGFSSSMMTEEDGQSDGNKRNSRDTIVPQAAVAPDHLSDIAKQILKTVCELFHFQLPGTPHSV